MFDLFCVPNFIKIGHIPILSKSVQVFNFASRFAISKISYSPILLMILVQMLIKNHIETCVSILTEMKLLIFKAL